MSLSAPSTSSILTKCWVGDRRCKRSSHFARRFRPTRKATVLLYGPPPDHPAASFVSLAQPNCAVNSQNFGVFSTFRRTDPTQRRQSPPAYASAGLAPGREWPPRPWRRLAVYAAWSNGSASSQPWQLSSKSSFSSSKLPGGPRIATVSASTAAPAGRQRFRCFKMRAVSLLSRIAATIRRLLPQGHAIASRKKERRPYYTPSNVEVTASSTARCARGVAAFCARMGPSCMDSATATSAIASVCTSAGAGAGGAVTQPEPDRLALRSRR